MPRNKKKDHHVAVCIARYCDSCRPWQSLRSIGGINVPDGKTTGDGWSVGLLVEE